MKQDSLKVFLQSIYNEHLRKAEQNFHEILILSIYIYLIQITFNVYMHEVKQDHPRKYIRYHN